MAQTTTCARCGEVNPADARFCIGCGESLVAAPATGATVKLKGNLCPACGAANPEHASYCVSCGRVMGGSTPQPEPRRQPSYVPPPSYPRPQPRVYPRVNTPPVYVPRPQHHVGPNPFWGGGPSMMLVMIMFLLFGLFSARLGWPFFVLFLPLGLLGGLFRRGGMISGGTARSMAPVFWIVGLLVLVASGFFWPGILFLWLLWMLFAR